MIKRVAYYILERGWENYLAPVFWFLFFLIFTIMVMGGR